MLALKPTLCDAQWTSEVVVGQPQKLSSVLRSEVQAPGPDSLGPLLAAPYVRPLDDIGQFPTIDSRRYRTKGRPDSLFTAVCIHINHTLARCIVVMTSSQIPSSILIIGSGVFGLSTAWSLCKNPLFKDTKITLVDRQPFPAPDGSSVSTQGLSFTFTFLLYHFRDSGLPLPYITPSQRQSLLNQKTHIPRSTPRASSARTTPPHHTPA